MSKKSEPLQYHKILHRPSLRFVYLILHLDSHQPGGSSVVLSLVKKIYYFAEFLWQIKCAYEGTPVVNKKLQKLCYKRKGTRGGAGIKRRGAGGVYPNTMAQDPPPHALHKRDGLERNKQQVIVQSPLLQLVKTQRCLGQKYLKKTPSGSRHKTNTIN